MIEDLKAYKKEWIRRKRQDLNFVRRERERVKENYKQNKEHYKEYNRLFLERRSKLIADFKREVGCLNPNCQWKGEYAPELLDFHHINPSTKVNQVPNLIKCWERCLAEIVKCTLVCANCHRLITHGFLDDTTFPYCRISDNLLLCNLKEDNYAQE